MLKYILIAFFVVPNAAQTPERPVGQRPLLAAPSAQRPVASLSQLMKGVLYPSSNVIFAAQSENPADVKPAIDAAMATNPLASTYGKWQAVENSALAIAEAANLVTIAGRKCSNGLDVPLKNADWPKLVQGLRDAGMKVYKAAQSKSQDDIVVTAGDLTEACDTAMRNIERSQASPNDASNKTLFNITPNPGVSARPR